MLYQRKRKQRTVYTQLYEGSITTPKGCIQFHNTRRYCGETPILYLYRKPSRNTPREWLLMTRHVMDINLAYTITKRKIYTNVEYNFHDRCTYVTLQAVFFFSRQMLAMPLYRRTVNKAACGIHAV